MIGEWTDLVDFLRAERFDYLLGESNQSLFITYEQSKLIFLVRAEQVYQAEWVEDLLVTMAADVGKEVNSISLLTCANFFSNWRPSFQVQSDSPTVSLSTAPSAAPIALNCPWYEWSTETMDSNLISGI